MRVSRGPACAVLVFALLCACTSSNTAPTTTPTSPVSTGTIVSPPPASGAVLADGTPLPAGCRPRTPAPAQTVTFAAQSQVWALDPSGGRLSCLIVSRHPEPFLWGPQADRVLLGGLRVAGWHDAPSYPPSAVRPSIADWGHPVGLAVVYTVPGGSRPLKFFMDTGRTETLTDLPFGHYLAVAYHPTGLALGFIIERDGRQSIWLSTNEGQQAKRLVFTKTGTTFSDLTFSADGQDLIYMAHHREGYSHLHTIDLAKPDTINSLWKGPVGEYVRTVDPSLDDQLFAVTEGTTCEEDHAALLIGGNGAERPLLPDVDTPTSVLGWLDEVTVLVGAGGCGTPMSVFEVPVSQSTPAQLLVSGVTVAASRAPAPTTPATLPREVLLDTGSGVG